MFITEEGGDKMGELVALNHLRLKYDTVFDHIVASAGMVVKIISILGTPECPRYEVEAFSGTRLASRRVVDDWLVEPIPLLFPQWVHSLNLRKRR